MRVWYTKFMNNQVKLVVFVPTTHSDIIKQAMGDAGAGVIGKYSHCSFSSKGIGKFKPLKGANPSIGEVGRYESTEEERIETVCLKDKVKAVIAAIRAVHPYEKVAFDIYPLISEEEFDNIA